MAFRKEDLMEVALSPASMSPGMALAILADVHTRDDDQLGYTVEIGARPEYGSRWSTADYIEAWGVVRAAVRSGAPLPDLRGNQPTAEDWRRACKEIVFGSRHVTMYDKVEERANELASAR